MGEVLDDTEHEQEQGHRYEDSQKLREELGQVLRRVGRDTEERQQVIEQRYHYYTSFCGDARAGRGQ